MQLKISTKPPSAQVRVPMHVLTSSRPRIKSMKFITENYIKLMQKMERKVKLTELTVDSHSMKYRCQLQLSLAGNKIGLKSSQ